MKSIIASQDINLVKKYAKESSSMKEFQVKLGYSQNSGKVNKTIEAFCKDNGISLEHFTNISSAITKRTPENVFIENSTATQRTLRRWYIKGNYTEYKCSICGQEPFWNGKELTLTLDHINGNNTDDRLENLRWVCPNCDRQLDTFGSKNIKNTQHIRVNQASSNYCSECGKEISHSAKLCPDCQALAQRKVKERPSAEELTQILIKYKGNFTKVGQMFSVTDNTIRKWCKAYQLPFHSSDYKKE